MSGHAARPTGRRRLALLLGLGLLTLVLGIAAFLALFEPVEETVERGPGPAARSNPLLAAEGLLRELGLPAVSRRGLRRLPAAGTTVVLYLEDPESLDSEQAGSLLDWVVEGGQLIAGPYPDLLAMAGAEAVPRGAEGRETLGLEAGGDALYQVSLPADSGLADWSEEAILAAGGEGGAALLRYAFGDQGGHLTLLSDLTFLTNGRIGEEEHAAFFAALVGFPRQPQGVWLLREGIPPTLLAVVAERAWMVLASAGALLLLWILRGTRPFGPPLPAPEPGRRSLREHLVASGDFLWRQGCAALLVASTREAALASAAADQPGWQRLRFRQRCERLAERTGLEAVTLAQALEGPPPADPAALIRTMTILETVRKS